MSKSILGVMTNKIFIRNAMLAAVYAALTIFLVPLSYEMLQIRVAEALQLIGFYDKRYIPGLTIGVVLANLNSPLGMLDVLVGTLATFIALMAMRYCKNIYQASLMPVISNGILVGAELYMLGLLPKGVGLALTMLYVAGGEFVAVSVLGVGLVRCGFFKFFERL